MSAGVSAHAPPHVHPVSTKTANTTANVVANASSSAAAAATGSGGGGNVLGCVVYWVCVKGMVSCIRSCVVDGSTSSMLREIATKLAGFVWSWSVLSSLCLFRGSGESSSHGSVGSRWFLSGVLA